MSDQSFENKESSSASLDEWLDQRTLPPSLDPPIPHSQTDSALSAEAERTETSPRRDTRSFNALGDVSDSELESSSSSDDEETTPYEIRRDTLLALLYELDDCLMSDEKMTASRRQELKWQVEWAKLLLVEFTRLRDSLPTGQGVRYYLKFEKKFHEFYYPLMGRMKKAFHPRSDTALDNRASKRKELRQPLALGKMSMSKFDCLAQKIEKFEAMDGAARETANVKAEMNKLRDEYLRALVSHTDIRYVDATKHIRKKLSKLKV